MDLKFLKFSICAILAMFAGSHIVYSIYQPMNVIFFAFALFTLIIAIVSINKSVFYLEFNTFFVVIVDVEGFQ